MEHSRSSKCSHHVNSCIRNKSNIISFLFLLSPVTILMIIIGSSSMNLAQAQQPLQVGFYSRTCPNAELIVRSAVRQAAMGNPRTAAAMLRLQFHDCFVAGCDGSILINRNNTDDEKHAFGHEGVGGLDLIETIKAQLERVCPGTVSCSDIVVMAARDAVAMAFGPDYPVETGRRDGRVSSISLAVDMPDVNDPIQVLKDKFAKKGLSPQDLVLLNAAHTIGTTACFFMTKRLYNFTGRNNIGDADPSINPAFISQLRTRCPLGGAIDVRLPLDPFSRDRFDEQILRNIRSGFAVIASDASLYEDAETHAVVEFYHQNPARFFPDFAAAMVKMGRIGVLTAPQGGEIRRVCRFFN